MKLYSGGHTVSVNGGPDSAASTPLGNVRIYADGATVEVKPSPGPASVQTGKYRDQQPYLFQRVRKTYELERFPGGGDYDYEYWTRQTSPGLPAPSGHGWTSPGIPKGGVTRDEVCPETQWRWNRTGGDVLSLVTAGNYSNLVRNPATLMPWHVSGPIGAVTGQQTISMPCTELAQFVQTQNRWCALLLRKQTGTARSISTRFAGNPPTPPMLHLVYTDDTTEDVACWVITSAQSTYSQQTHITPPTECFVEFARPSKPVKAASLAFTVIGGSAAATYGLWLLDPPRNAGTVVLGIANDAPMDAGLASHPSIIDVQQFPDSLTPAQLAAKYINNSITNQMAGGEAFYDPALWNRGPTDVTKLPHTCRNQWLFADNSTDAQMTPVPSSYAEHGFVPLAPGIGAMRVRRLPLAGFGDGVSTASIDDGHNLGAVLLLPADLWGIEHIFVRAYWFIAEPEREGMEHKRNYTRTGVGPRWSDQGGKTLIMPYCASSYGSGFSGTSGGPSGYQLRGAWSAAGTINDDGPCTGGTSLGLHTFDFGNHCPPGFAWGEPSRFGMKGGHGGILYSRRWYCIEVEVKLNDVLDASGAIIGKLPANNNLGGFLPNGEIRYWLDGVLDFERTGLVMRTLPMAYGGTFSAPVLTDPGYIATLVRPTRNLGIKSLLFNLYHGGQSPNAVLREWLYTELAYGTEYIGPMRLAA